jgi:hypothetical protein
VTSFCHYLLQQLAFSESRHLAGIRIPPELWPITEIVHDISFLLADGTIMYDAYKNTNDVVPGTLCVDYQDPLVLNVLLWFQ